MDVSIYVCETQAVCDTYAEKAFCGSYAGPPVDPTLPQRVWCKTVLYGRFLRIRQLTLDGYLTLCEVQAYY